MSMFDKFSPPSGGGKTFLKIQPDTKVKGILVGEPIQLEKEFKGEKKWRFRSNFIITENGAYIAKILEGGAAIFNQLKDLEDDGWDLTINLVTISRKGSGMETKYTVTPDPKGKLSEKQLDQIRAVELLDLSPQNGGAVVTAEAEGGGDEPPPF